MKSLITLVMFSVAFLVPWRPPAMAKDPPAKKPHIYVVVAIYNKTSTSANGTTMYAMMAKDLKGDMIVVGISKEAVGQLQQIAEPTAISYGCK